MSDHNIELENTKTTPSKQEINQKIIINTIKKKVKHNIPLTPSELKMFTESSHLFQNQANIDNNSNNNNNNNIKKKPVQITPKPQAVKKTQPQQQQPLIQQDQMLMELEKQREFIDKQIKFMKENPQQPQSQQPKPKKSQINITKSNKDQEELRKELKAQKKEKKKLKILKAKQRKEENQDDDEDDDEIFDDDGSLDVSQLDKDLYDHVVDTFTANQKPIGLPIREDLSMIKKPKQTSKKPSPKPSVTTAKKQPTPQTKQITPQPQQSIVKPPQAKVAPHPPQATAKPKSFGFQFQEEQQQEDIEQQFKFQQEQAQKLFDQKSNQTTTTTNTSKSSLKNDIVEKKDKKDNRDKKDKKDNKDKKEKNTKFEKKDKKESRDKKDKKDKKEPVKLDKKSKNGKLEKEEPKKKSNGRGGEESNTSGSNTGGSSRSNRPKFEKHITREQLEIGLAEGKYFFGQIRVNPKKYNDAYITVQGSSADVFVEALKDRNRAFHTDVVAFEIYEDIKTWKSRPKSSENGNTKEEDSDVEMAIIKDTTSQEAVGDAGTVVLKSSTLDAMKEKQSIEQNFQFQMGDMDEETGELILREELHQYNSAHHLEDESEIDSEDDINQLSGKTTAMAIHTDSDNSESEKKNNNKNNNNNNESTVDKSKSKSKKSTTTIQLKQNLDKLEEYLSKGAKEGLYATAKVVYIVEEKHSSSHVGMIIDDVNSQIFAQFLPIDTTLPKCLIFKETIPQFRTNPEKYKTSLVSVKYGAWKETSTYPSGRFKALYGECGQIEPETKALLDEFQVDTKVFSKEVMACLPKVSGNQWSINKKELEIRKDLRSYDIVTIDPDSAKDLDDALHCIQLDNGNFEVGVHIADVSHFVKPGTELDKCAAQKATTVYLVQKAIPMLPSLLSEELCSLNMGVERYAFSVIWTLTPEGKIVDEWFGKSVIKSFCRLTYAAAQAIISDEIQSDWNQFHGKVRPEFGPNTPEHISRVRTSVLGLRSIAKNLREKRVANGAFTIHPTKLAFELDGKGNPISTKVYPIMESNKLVEEFMLLANMRVAEKIATSFPSNSLLRRHPDPNPSKLQNFISFCAKHGWEIDSSSVGSFGESIQLLKDKVEDPRILQAIQLLSVRSMRLAEYFCSASEEQEMWHHYALNVDFYTHFTSPIRRYADIIVHRLLEIAIQLDKMDVQNVGNQLSQLPTAEQLDQITNQCNEKKLLARKAQERSDKVFLCILLQNTITITSAVVLSCGNNFLTVIVPQFGSEQKIFFDDLKQRHLITGSRYDDQENTVLWAPIEGISTTAHIQKIKELSIVNIKLEVNKEKFPIDTKCVLLHPLMELN
ncbi:putative ribonuclease II domain containing protein [Tieghemostelium lacteum]|uniref:DIS3-like exonuclease 2 n=1 Tax=Tieghemostelium lacteum TaxID=361077 RepID=A0A151Z6R4_TIELA|nr:putative ribonuclease II domain containing protein [Tieghemostelium lacteum]|eukprot:KYQ89653.1 putative ribonuclease II domain containing protein [Tieghemostelium lacteum]